MIIPRIEEYHYLPHPHDHWPRELAWRICRNLSSAPKNPECPMDYSAELCAVGNGPDPGEPEYFLEQYFDADISDVARISRIMMLEDIGFEIHFRPCGFHVICGDEPVPTPNEIPVVAHVGSCANPEIFPVKPDLMYRAHGGEIVSLWGVRNLTHAKYQALSAVLIAKFDCTAALSSPAAWIPGPGHESPICGDLYDISCKRDAYHLLKAFNVNPQTISARSLDQFLTGARIQRALVEGLIPTGGYTQIFGAPGSGKSFVAIDIALSVASGRDWHGHEVRQGPVYFIAAESESSLPNRFRAWAKKHDVPLSDLQFSAHDGAVDLVCRESIQELALDVQHEANKWGRPPVLLVIDPLTRCLGEADEDRPDVANRVAGHLDQNFMQRYGSAVLQVHHSGHKENRRARGSSAWRAALDADYSVSRRGDCIMIRNEKMRNGPQPEPITLRMESVTLGDIDSGSDSTCQETSIVLKRPDQSSPRLGSAQSMGTNQRKALNSLRELLATVRDPGEGVDVRHWRDTCREKGIDRRRIVETEKSLSEKGLIKIEAERVFLAYL